MKFAFSPAARAAFAADGLRTAFAYRDLGIAEATGGRFHAQVIRAADRPGPDEPGAGGWHTHDLAFQLVYVLRGHAVFDYEGQGRVRMGPGDAVHQPPGIRHRLVEYSDDMELLEITSPAEFGTAEAEPPADTPG